MTLPPRLLLGLCAGVCPFTAGNTGQDCVLSEAGGQLVEWDASITGWYKVSSQRHTQDHPVSSHTFAPHYFICLLVAYKMSNAGRHKEGYSHEKENATCTILKSTQHKHTRRSWA